jgi:murein DD-endopeptidase MepM/ murein hydrolase activator NlpD
MIPSWGPAYGNHSVVVEYAKERYVLFAHLSSNVVKVGQVVKAGDLLGKSGAEGNVAGPHLHMEVQAHNGYTKGAAVDPQPVLDYQPAVVAPAPKPVAKPAVKPAVKKAVAPKK